MKYGSILLSLILTYILWLFVAQAITSPRNLKYIEFHQRVFSGLCDTNYDKFTIEAAKNCEYFRQNKENNGI